MREARISDDQSCDETETPSRIELQRRLPRLLIDMTQIQNMRERRQQLDRLRAWAARREGRDCGR